MANSYFRFQKFTIHHDRCAMKVGTDGVLLGSWAEASEDASILDIGTGTGLIALMMAQRFPQAKVMALDVETNAVAQATENAANSPFANQVTIINHDVRTYNPQDKYDSIVCNPPFYSEDILPSTDARRIARNTSTLSFDALAKCVARLLAPMGVFNVIIPTKAVSELESLCLIQGLYVKRKCDIRTTHLKQPKRTMLTFTFSKTYSLLYEELIILCEDGKYSPKYNALTNDFYLQK